ncbi:hypothetical protein KR038_008738 [Drosophila bunnanda]|nr:hypothetical protein KR038_008738 [Drosophila bunnanda]
MEAESLKLNVEEQKKTDTSLVPRNRPDIYTAAELFRSLVMWTMPVMDVLTWQLPIVTISWLILGLITIYILTSVSLPSLLGLMGLAVMGLVMLYAAVERVEPFQELSSHQMLARMRVPPEAVDLVADRVTNWVNRWVATGQYVIFGQDYRPSILVSAVALYLVIVCATLGSSTVIMMAYCFAFILPQMCLRLNHFNQLPRKLFKNQNLLQLNEKILDGQEQIHIEEYVPEKEDSTESQHPEVSNI